MGKLERLFQVESGQICRKGDQIILSKLLVPVGKIKALVIKSENTDITEIIEKMIESKTLVLPAQTNSYILSDFEEVVQEIKENGKKEVYAVYAVQFYLNLEEFNH